MTVALFWLGPMRIVHRISFAGRPEYTARLDHLGVRVPESGFVSFELDEADTRWAAIKSWVERTGVVDIIRTEFAADEIDGAPWLEFEPTWHWSYPQPNENDFGYLKATYDLTSFCSTCGIGLRQRAPFQVKREPNWGRCGMLQLNWVFDEYFVRRDHEELFASFDVPVRAVVNRKGERLESIVQLDVAQLVDVKADGLGYEKCPVCGRIKYDPIVRGPFPPIEDVPSVHAVKTRQYFGSGASAYRAVLVSAELGREVRAHQIKGISLYPVSSKSMCR